MSVAIFLASNKPVAVPTPFASADKVYHFFAYAFYGWTLNVAAQTLPLPPKKATLYALIVGLLFGASDEVHQYFIPGRSADPFDWIADALGIATITLLCYWKQRHGGTRNVV